MQDCQVCELAACKGTSPLAVDFDRLTAAALVVERPIAPFDQFCCGGSFTAGSINFAAAQLAAARSTAADAAQLGPWPRSMN